jgi:alpha-D-xyloside xylohydrolase
MQEQYDFMNLPLLVRPNTVLPMSTTMDRPEYDYSSDVILKVFQLENGTHLQVEIPNLSGNAETLFDVQRANDVIRIERQGSSKTWKILLVGIHSIESDQASEQTSEGMLFSLQREMNVLEIKILPE